MRIAKIDNDAEYYYEYILLYIDDFLVVGEHLYDGLKRLNKYFPLKPEWTTKVAVGWEDIQD